MPSKRTAVFYATYFGVLGVVLPFLGPYLASRGLGGVGIGLATAAFSLPKLVFAPVLGLLVDRGRWFRGLLTAHVGLSALAAFAIAWIVVPWTYAPALFLIGVGYGTVLPLVEATVLERLPGPGYGALRLWGSVGFVLLATASGAVLGGRLGAFPFAVGAALLALLVSCAPFERAAQPTATARGRTRATGALVALLALLTLHQVSHGPYYAFFSLRVAGAGYGAVAIAALWSAGVIAELVAFRAGATLERSFGLKRLLGAALVLTPVRWLLLALPPTAPVLVLAQIGHAATFAVAHLAGIQLVQRAAPAGAARATQALYSGLAFGLGVVAGTALAGPAWAAWGGAGTFLAAAILSAAVAAAWPWVSKRLETAPIAP